MSITMAQLKKNLKRLDERVDNLRKAEAFTDGAVESKVKQLEGVKAGSGTTGDVPKNDLASGAFVDGAQKKEVARDLNSKAGSGAAVSEKFANVTNQTGKHFNDGAKDKEEMQKCPKSMAKPKTKSVAGKGSKNPADKAKKAKVPSPKGGDASSKTSSKK
jgi:hypothetical protein